MHSRDSEPAKPMFIDSGAAWIGWMELLWLRNQHSCDAGKWNNVEFAMRPSSTINRPKLRISRVDKCIVK
jgi:hypothetical protein